jgi:two-component system, chemotaxis family, sensor kinase CheA
MTARTNHRFTLGVRGRLTAQLTAMSALTWLLSCAVFVAYEARADRGVHVALAALTASLVLASALSYWLHRALRRRVSTLLSAARRVRQQRDLRVRSERVSDDELGELSDAFNAMLATLESRDRELTKYHRELQHQAEQRDSELARHKAEWRRVLDSINQGVLTIDQDGVPFGERSAVIDRWFGAPEPGQTLGQLLARGSIEFGDDFQRAFGELREGLLPLPLQLAQLPSVVATEEGRYYQLRYEALDDPTEHSDKLLVVVSDVTERVDKARIDADRVELIALLERIAADRGSFSNFYRETEGILERLTSEPPGPHVQVMRQLHTLKSNFALFGLKPLAQLVNEIEDSCAHSGEGPSSDDRHALHDAWIRFSERARTVLGDGVRSVNVDRDALEQLREAVRAERPRAELLRLVGRLTYEPVGPKLARMGERARYLATRMGKGPVDIELDSQDVVAPPSLGWLWSVLPHVVANSVDHGLDAESERAARGKPTAGKLRIAAIERPDCLIVEIEDDGRGIDWEAVRARAKELGLPSESAEDLVHALFADGVTTRANATEVSGRGVGLAAVDAACRQHGAHIGVESRPGAGTLFRITVSNANDSADARGQRAS